MLWFFPLLPLASSFKAILLSCKDFASRIPFDASGFDDFSLVGMILNLKFIYCNNKQTSQPVLKKSTFLAQFSKVLVKQWDSFDPFIIVENIIFLIGRMQRVAIQAKAH
jgi:hypothetical protein